MREARGRGRKSELDFLEYRLSVLCERQGEGGGKVS